VPLDHATAALLEQVAATGAPALHEQTPEQARQAAPMITDLIGPGPQMAWVSEATLEAVGAGSFTVRALVPTGSPTAVLVYYHGGGWVLGDIEGYDTLARKLAVAANSVVVLVDYRKAPEHPHPAAVEDAWTALRWAGNQVEALAGARVPLVVAGDSAGGNLAAIMTHWSRDRPGPVVAAQVLVYPVTDADLSTSSYLDPENQLLLSRETMIWFWDHYVPDAAARVDPSVSPLRSPSLEGLPPAILLTAEFDVLRDEGEAYGDRLRSAGVSVTSRRFDGQMHAFFSMTNILPGSDDAIAYIAQELHYLLTVNHASASDHA
jgi:acetyl esterase